MRAVIDNSGRDHLSSLDADIEVHPTGSHFPIGGLKGHEHHVGTSTQTHQSRSADGALSQGPGALHSGDRWLRECRSALVRKQVIEIDYAAVTSRQPNKRMVEPIGLFYYSWHWHLIGWCRLREAYRDFRLDRVLSVLPQPEQTARHSRLTLKQYLSERPGQQELQEVELLFGHEAARYVGEQRYMFGFVEEARQHDGVRMRFLTHVPQYMARWLPQYTNDVEVISGDCIKESLQQFSAHLATHWNGKSQPS